MERSWVRKRVSRFYESAALALRCFRACAGRHEGRREAVTIPLRSDVEDMVESGGGSSVDRGGANRVNPPPSAPSIAQRKIRGYGDHCVFGLYF